MTSPSAVLLVAPGFHTLATSLSAGEAYSTKQRQTAPNMFCSFRHSIREMVFLASGK